ncbi:MAG: DUF2490 domain-containing protein [Acidobacteria bacterium]|nr:DUF2490 domain-containing protein [Acidobacteriota bacterium]
MRQGCQFVAMVFAITLPAGATELFSWHTMDTTLIQKGRFELSSHHRTRTRQELTYLDQSRVGAIGRWTARPKLVVLAGYYFQPQQLRDDLWTRGHRVWGGVEAPLWSKPGHLVSGRLLMERHLSTGRADYFRYRTSLRYVAGKGRVRPFIQNEVLAAWPGFHSTRNSGGVMMRLNDQLSLDVSYLYDVRRTFWGGDRQSVVTSMKWTPRWRLR